MPAKSPKLLSSLPAGLCRQKDPNGVGQFLLADRSVLKAGLAAGLRLAGLAKWFALTRPGLYWMHPAFGTEPSSVPAETQMLLWRRTDGQYGLLVPLVAGDIRATLAGGEEGLGLSFEGALPGEEPESARVLFAAAGADPFALVASAMDAVADALRTFRPRTQKNEPAFLDWLGWCTWDAFYHTVDEAKVLAGLKSFRDGGVQPGFVILDDGWKDVQGDHLNEFRANPEKFPNGLAPLIRRAKREFGVRLFGAWHCFEGYWAGINPAGPLAQRYRLVHNAAVIRPWIKPEKTEKLYLVHPDDIHRFFQEFHHFLRAEGVDMVKVDGQSALELFTKGRLGRVSTMRTFQEALQGAAQTHFTGNIIHCMSNGSDVALHMAASQGWRNSQDYFPKRGDEAQQAHVHLNAMNSFWTGTFSIPDWDMFQTHGAAPAYHAAARALSGGPVYVCDYPGQQDFDLLRKLVTTDGRALRPDRPALPAEDCLLTDCRREAKLLKVTNRCGPIGLLGLFHCQAGGGSIRDRYRPADVHDLPGTRFAAWHHTTGQLAVLGRDKARAVELGPVEFELVTLAPIEKGFAVLGLLDKFAAPAAVTGFGLLEGAAWARLRDGGRVGFYCQQPPAAVRVNGRKARFAHDAATGLLTVAAPTGGPVEVTLRW